MKRYDPLASLQRFGWRFGLDTVRSLLACLGDPHRDLPCVQVAGSNGKGATAAFLASILRAAGYRTGLYTSPHLSDPRERFRLDGRVIPCADHRRLARRVLRACGGFRSGRLPTYFEAQTALAFLWFRERRVDVAVLETGLGGRLDATNVVDAPLACLITPVGMEHRDILGPTLERITAEKAGILKRGCLAATLQTDSRPLQVLRRKAEERGAFLWVAGEDFPDRVSLPPGRPSFDAANAALAAAGARLLRHRGFRIDEDAIRLGLSAMRWPGRFEPVSRRPLILLDGAHNPPATEALAEALRTRRPGGRWVVLNGYLRDKDASSCVSALAPVTAVSVVTDPPSARAGGGERVFRAWESRGVRSFYVRDWKQALALARRKGGGAFPLLVTGSLYLVGACREVLVGGRGLDRI
jgi:dihydrofolate synthase/folylpolyglutamate synthase